MHRSEASRVIRPHRGVGLIEFGMCRADVCDALGGNPRAQRTNSYGLPPEDVFDSLIIEYEPGGECCMIAVGSGFGPLYYELHDLFSTSAVAAREWVRSIDSDIRTKDGFTSVALGLGMYAPWIDENDLSDEDRAQKAETFMVFRRGYHDV